MIVVRVELWSHITGQQSTLGVMTISNRGDHPEHKKGNYDVSVLNKTHAKALDEGNADNFNKGLKNPLRKGNVENYPRLSYNVWRLVTRALRSAFPEEK